ncbi:MAG: discoidin domain-containing protein [Verrucomicrobia bacterium]|nr:discoidin domain-containing protein [Verrucomicrobiota bacterium]
MKTTMNRFRLSSRCQSVVGLALLLVCALPSVSRAASESISLAGRWRFQLDREDVGVTNRWFERSLERRIQLPGALQNQGFGDDIMVDTKWTGEVGSDRWKRRPEYAKYREPGNIKVPFFLQPEKHYVGAAWYQRDVEIPPAWLGKRITLTLERPHWETRVWLDGSLLGTNNSLGTPHVYDLGTGAAPGKHTLTLRVDNRVLVEVGDWSHSVSDHTQGNWNGVVGRIELSAAELVSIEDLQVYPHVATKSVTVKGRVANTTGQTSTNNIALCLLDRFDARPRLPTTNVTVKWGAQSGTFEAELAVPGAAATWDEFNPRLYELTAWTDVRLDRQNAKQVVFGLREIAARGREFLINGRPIFFRGTLECCIFPKTGYPPTDVESWQKVIRACKAHGLNHIRFHSWCPPEAAFVAADQLGFYYQVECGVWTQPGNGKPIDQWLYDESERIVRAYGNHPSFVLLTHGNEPHGPKREEYLAKWVEFWKRDGRFLVTSGSAYPQLPENQYHVFHGPRGPHGWLGKDYRKDIEKLTVPVIVHEMGQWCVFPNFDEIRKYTGPLKPKNFEIFRDSLQERGMLDQWRDFLRASGRLQVLCYKEEIEAAMRTPGVGGVQLLDLHDFPGQGTALVGVLDPFWEEKGYVKPEEFCRFCNTTVPLARLLRRTWTTDETLIAEVEVAHFGAAPLENVATEWKLVSGKGTVVARGEFPVRTIPLGQGTSLGRIDLNLSKLAAPQAYKLVVAVKNTPFENDWNVWVYPAKPDSTTAADVLVATALDTAALGRLDAGGKVLLLPAKLSSEHPRLRFEPIFWNRYMFNSQPQQTLGLLCNAKHPALAQFPTEDFQDWQWRDIVTNARGMALDDLPGTLRPVVQPIDDWNSNRRLGLVFECRVGPGKLLVCAADLEKNLDQRAAARQLRASLLAYAASSRFAPKVEVTKEALAKMLARNKPSRMVQLGARVIEADSEDREHDHLAAHAIDGDAETFWHTCWQPKNDPMPHHLIVDLGREVSLKSFTCLPRQDQANGRIAECEFFLSNDPKVWAAPVAKARWSNGGQLQTVELKPPQKARFVRVLVTAEINRNPFAALAELDVLTEP